MHPTLLRFDTGPDAIGEVSISSYFGFVAIGFALAIFMFWRIGGLQKLKRDSLLDLGLYMIIFGVLGARLLHVIADGQFWNYVHWCTDHSAVVWEVTEIECRSRSLQGVWDAGAGVCRPENPEQESIWTRCTLWLQFWRGGLAFYGGFLLASAYGIYFIRKEKLPLQRVLDMTGWAIPFGLGWGRMGCYLNGCCYGVHVAEQGSEAPWWAEAFPRWSPAWRDHLNADLIGRSADFSLFVHPTQIYESVAAFMVAGIGYFYLEPRKRFAGEVFLSSCFLYAVARFLIEYLRDDERGALLGLSTSQIIALVVCAIVGLAWSRVKNSSERQLATGHDG